MDYKLWITDRADEIAQDLYACNYTDITHKDLQAKVFAQAESDYGDCMADAEYSCRIDRFA